MSAHKLKNSDRLFFLAPVLLAPALLLSGCETLGPELGITKYMLPELDESKAEEQQDSEVFAQLGNEDLEKKQGKVAIEEYYGSGRFVSNKTGGHKASAPNNGKYTLNFDGADLREVTKIVLSDMLNENYVINPKVGGRVTLQTSRPLTKGELMPTLEMLLRMNGAAIVKDRDIYNIEPEADAVQSGSSPKLGLAGQSLPPGYQIRVVPLEYVGVSDMEEILKPIMPAKGILRVDKARNLLMIAGSGQELERILDTIQIFDVNVMEGMSFGLYPLENTEVTEIVGELEKLFDKDAQTPMAGMFRFVPIERLNAVLIITHQPRYLQEIKKWVVRLDRTDSVTGEGVMVYRAQHVVATELAATLDSVFTGTTSSYDKKPSLAPGQQAASITNKQVDKKNDKTTMARSATRSGGSRNTNGNSNDPNDLSNVRVIADEPNNALIIMARPQQYKIIQTIIKQLDVMPLQVLINADIFEVTLKDNLEYGVRWLFTNDLPGGAEGIGLFRAARNAVLTSTGIPGGFSYGVMGGSDELRVLIDMLEDTNKINLLSSPSLLVLNNQEASIQVGDQVPIRTSESTNTSGGGVNPIQTSNIEMRDTGVTLNVTPRVNAGGVVIMDIEQSVDNVKQTEFSNIDSPTISQRKITTSLAVTSGETIVLGGLIREEHTYSNGGIPFLKDLPWIGPAFSSTKKKKDKVELIVMITPSVLANKYDANKVTREYQRKLTGIYEALPPKPETPEPPSVVE